jgi:hypothetical protein
MSVAAKLREEIRSLGLVSLYFAAWIFVLLLLKWLILAEYQIEFHGLSMVVVGALILAKVVLVLDHVPLGSRSRERPALFEVVVRTGMYGLGVLVVLLLEKAFEMRHEYGGFVPSLAQVIHHQDAPQVLAAAIGVTGALLVFNASFVIRRHLGKRGLLEIFLSPLPEQSKAEP